MSVRSLQFSPVTVHVRAVYALFLLVKIFVSASAPEGHLNEVLDPGTARLSFYLHRLRLKFIDVASQGCRMAVKFCNIAVKLQEWFDAQQSQGFRGQLQDSEFIQPFRYLSIGRDDCRVGSSQRMEAPSSKQVAPLTTQKLAAGNSQAKGSHRPQNVSAGMQGSDDFGFLNPGTHDASATLQTDSHHWPSNRPGQPPDDSLPTFDFEFNDEFLDANLDLDLNLNMVNNNGADGLTTACLYPLETLPFLPSMDGDIYDSGVP